MAYISSSRSIAAFGRTARVSLLDLLSLSRQRRDLARLPDHMLNDIGMTRKEADQEAKRGFWDVPDHWLK